MADRKFHYIDETIQTDFPKPRELEWLIEQAEQADLDEDDAYFEFIDSIDVTAKNAYADGKLTLKQWEALVLKYRGVVIYG